jgi:hypothetical protein
MKDKIFKDPPLPDPFKHVVNIRDGAMSILIGVVARKSIDFGKSAAISELTDLVPQATKL